MPYNNEMSILVDLKWDTAAGVCRGCESSGR
jgi:hypothetical protein